MGDLENEIIEDLNRQYAEAVMKDVAMSMTTSAVGNLSVDEYGNYGVVSSTGPVPYKFASVDDALKLADANLLTAVEKSSIDSSIAIMEESEFKRISKERLATKLREEVAKKAKYTMLRDDREQTITTRAKVYVFSEQELRNFIEKIT